MIGRIPIAKTDDLDILSGVWIMSCNDDNPIMTYRSISHRLNLPDTYDVKALVRSRPELFRLGILNSRLNAWKDLMKSGKNRPNWIVEIRDHDKQREAIDSLSREDVFRSQFRVEDQSPKSPIEIVDWGLQHIERLRRAAAEEREARSRKWNSIIIPLASLMLVGFSTLSTIWLQRSSSREQVALKHCEVSFVPKQRAYSDFMIDLEDVVGAAEAGNKQDFLVQTERMNSAFYSLEPFLGDGNRHEIRDQYSKFLSICANEIGKPKEGNPAELQQFLSTVVDYKKSFRVLLFPILFEDDY